MTWQLPQVQTVYGYSVIAIAVFHSSSVYLVSACDTYDFQAVKTGLSCSSKQQLAVGSTIEVKQKSCKQ